jgi:histidinol-phosphate aminotransferase
LADLHGVAAWRIVLAASASEFIFRTTAWVRRDGGRRVWLPAAAYGDYAHAAQAWGLERSNTLEEADLAWACEPSSPLGQAHALWPQWLQPARAAVQRPATAAASPVAAPGPARRPGTSRQQLVLDGAYAPLRLSGQPGLDSHQRDAVWQLFSPNKALALTGIRAAYAIAPLHAERAAQALEAMAPSWPVGAHGEAMLLAWTKTGVQEWVAQTLPTLRDWKQAQVAMLLALGWHCQLSDAHFYCARPPAGADLAGLLQFLRPRGIKLRDATSLGLPGWLRLSAQPPAAQQALQTGLLAWASQGAAQPQTGTPNPFPAQADQRTSSLETMQ